MTLEGGGNTLYVLGVTDQTLNQLKLGFPIRQDLREMGGHDTVVIVHGRTAVELRAALAEVLPRGELSKLISPLDQLDAQERDAA
ncbi:MAG: hypothetical protein LC798_20720 [Chloroflexi bacterium]|nr:hypothetical protein [Chloroflexota bacterium]